MPYVEFYKLQNDGTQKMIAVCKLKDGKTICEGDKILIENLKQKGVFDYSSGQKGENLFLKDGLKFLENLKYNFASGYLNASDIKEDK